MNRSAIGTGKTATPNKQKRFIDLFARNGETLLSSGAEVMRIQYGGSVTPENVKGLMIRGIDGAL